MALANNPSGRRRTREERIAFARIIAAQVLKQDDISEVSYKELGKKFDVDPGTVRNYLGEWVDDVPRVPGLSRQEHSNRETILSWMQSKTTTPEKRDQYAKLAIEMLEDMAGEGRYGVRSLREIALLLSVSYWSLNQWIADYEQRYPQTSFSSKPQYRSSPANGVNHAAALGDADLIAEIREADSHRLQMAGAMIEERLAGISQ